jgi:hypothetical protein
METFGEHNDLNGKSSALHFSTLSNEISFWFPKGDCKSIFAFFSKNGSQKGEINLTEPDRTNHHAPKSQHQIDASWSNIFQVNSFWLSLVCSVHACGKYAQEFANEER